MNNSFVLFDFTLGISGLKKILALKFTALKKKKTWMSWIWRRINFPYFTNFNWHFNQQIKTKKLKNCPKNVSLLDLLFLGRAICDYPRKKTSLERVSPRVMHRIRSESLGKILGETLWREKSRQESHRDSRQKSHQESRRGSRQDSWRLSARLLTILRAKESRQESCQESRIGSYAWLSASLSETRFLRGYPTGRSIS